MLLERKEEHSENPPDPLGSHPFGRYSHLTWVRVFIRCFRSPCLQQECSVIIWVVVMECHLWSLGGGWLAEWSGVTRHWGRLLWVAVYHCITAPVALCPLRGANRRLWRICLEKCILCFFWVGRGLFHRGRELESRGTERARAGKALSRGLRLRPQCCFAVTCLALLWQLK